MPSNMNSRFDDPFLEEISRRDRAPEYVGSGGGGEPLPGRTVSGAFPTKKQIKKAAKEAAKKAAENSFSK